jgi:hypothetical protein
MAPGVKAAARWAAVFGGATVGSWAGRMAAAQLHGEPVEPLLRPDLRAILE